MKISGILLKINLFLLLRKNCLLLSKLELIMIIATIENLEVTEEEIHEKEAIETFMIIQEDILEEEQADLAREIPEIETAGLDKLRIILD